MGAGGLQGLNAAALAVFERLKAWRRDEARTQSVPAYVILHDATLAEIARRKPASLAELAGVGGIGTKKLARYGDALMSISNASPRSE